MPICAAKFTITASKHGLAGFEKINAWYYPDAPETVQPMLDTLRRQSTFDEVVGGLDETNARFEARPVLVLRQLLRVRFLLHGLPGHRRDASSAWKCATSLITTTAPAAGIALRNAPAAPST